jgi:hypothetical protein
MINGMTSSCMCGHRSLPDSPGQWPSPDIRAATTRLRDGRRAIHWIIRPGRAAHGGRPRQNRRVDRWPVPWRPAGPQAGRCRTGRSDGADLVPVLTAHPPDDAEQAVEDVLDPAGGWVEIGDLALCVHIVRAAYRRVPRCGLVVGVHPPKGLTCARAPAMRRPVNSGPATKAHRLRTATDHQRRRACRAASCAVMHLFAYLAQPGRHRAGHRRDCAADGAQAVPAPGGRRGARRRGCLHGGDARRRHRQAAAQEPADGCLPQGPTAACCRGDGCLLQGRRRIRRGEQGRGRSVRGWDLAGHRAMFGIRGGRQVTARDRAIRRAG